MAQALVGYQLVDSSGAVLQSWGGVWGQYPSVPDFIVLPNGDQVHNPVVGHSYSDWTLQNWLMDSPVIPQAKLAASLIAAGSQPGGGGGSNFRSLIAGNGGNGQARYSVYIRLPFGNNMPMLGM
jgi:hypothetical protein